MEKQGAGFVTRDGVNLLAGAEEWVAPVHAQVAPDGAVWVADWYNFISQHNPTPIGHSNGPGNAYETSMRDRHRGRIYRVVYKNAPPASRTSLTKSDPAGLLRALASDNMFWRLHAQRLLVERGQKDVVPQLIALARTTSVDAVGTNGAALHALWTLHGLGELASTTTEAGRTAVEALKHPAGGVRKAAAMVLPDERRVGLPRSWAPACCRIPTCTPDWRRSWRLPTCPRLPRSATRSTPRAWTPATTATDGSAARCISPHTGTATRSSRGIGPILRHCHPAPFPSRSAWEITGRTGAPPAPTSLAADWKETEVPGKWESRGLPGLRRRRLVFAHRAMASGAVGHQPDAWAHRKRRRSLGQRTGNCRAAGLDRRADRRPRRSTGYPTAACDREPTRLPFASRIFGATADSSPRLTRCTSRAATAKSRWRNLEVSCRTADQRRPPLLEARRACRSSRPGDVIGASRARAERRGASACASARRHREARCRSPSTEVRQERVDGGAGTARRAGVREPGRDAAQLHTRRAWVAAANRVGGRCDDDRRSRRGAAVRAGGATSAVMPRRWSIPAKPSRCGSGRPTSRASTRTFARSPVIGA